MTRDASRWEGGIVDDADELDPEFETELRKQFRLRLDVARKKARERAKQDALAVLAVLSPSMPPGLFPRLREAILVGV